MIKTAGANVSPREVEAVITELTGLVAHVVGIDDRDRGQIVAAALRVPAGQEPPDTDALRAELRTRLSAYKVPRRYLVLADDDVPMLSSGKLDPSRVEGVVRVSATPLPARRRCPRSSAATTRTTARKRPSSPRTARSPTRSSTTRVARSRRRLVAAGVGKGARVGLLAPNGIEWALIAAAVTRVGGVLVPLSTLLRPPELVAQLQVAGGHCTSFWCASSAAVPTSTTSRR